MEKAEKNNNRSVLVVIILICLGLIFSSISLVLYSINKKPLQSVEYDVFFVVEEGRSLGVDLNNTVLTFGRTSPSGHRITRPVLITNNYDFPISIEVFVSENVVDVLELNFSYNLESGKNISIPIRLSIPESYPLGNHSGKIRFDLYRLKE